ncbi:hypothetical protein NQZ68_008539 [Dissostichus eleginoides]|nr:hypothetical protein NQZ68_008539 [Dissostichus eleginoides]
MLGIWIYADHHSLVNEGQTSATPLITWHLEELLPIYHRFKGPLRGPGCCFPSGTVKKQEGWRPCSIQDPLPSSASFSSVTLNHSSRTYSGQRGI